MEKVSLVAYNYCSAGKSNDTPAGGNEIRKMYRSHYLERNLLS